MCIQGGTRNVQNYQKRASGFTNRCGMEGNGDKKIGTLRSRVVDRRTGKYCEFTDGKIVRMNPNCVDKIVKSSIHRLRHDSENGFEFLRKVPSVQSRIFAQYWIEKADSEAFAKYLRAIPHPKQLGYERVSVAGREFSEFADRAIRRWEFRSVPMKQTLGLIFLKRGRLADYQREGATDEDLRKYGNLEWHWPTERAIIKAFSSSFEIRLLHRENKSSAEYEISTKHGVNSCATRLIVNTRLKILSYAHLLNDFTRHFVLIDHSGDWCLNIWNLVTEENLEEAVHILRKIVTDFESDVE
jgi:hypothetical protein